MECNISFASVSMSSFWPVHLLPDLFRKIFLKEILRPLRTFVGVSISSKSDYLW
jgi:hypothetical protein